MNDHENVLRIQRTDHALEGRDARLGSILVDEGKLRPADLDQVMTLQEVEGLRFGDAALRLDLISADDLQRALARQYGYPQLLAGDNGVSDELVAAIDPGHPCAEQLRTLRTQLLLKWFNAGTRHRMLALVSAGRGDGRSFVAANLAVAFAQLGERTLLIDADLRAPRQHRIFNVSNRYGLSAVLSGRADRDVVVHAPAFGTLSLLPAGARPPNPQELLMRPVFASFLDEVRNDFDVILFDTPPARRYADAQTLVFRAGSAIVIMRRNRTRTDDVNLVIRDLVETGANIVGTLFNAF